MYNGNFVRERTLLMKLLPVLYSYSIRMHNRIRSGDKGTVNRYHKMPAPEPRPGAL